METVLNSDLHLDGIVGIGRYAKGMNPDVFLLDDVGHSTGNSNSDEISEP